jgi:hypothetical protein
MKLKNFTIFQSQKDPRWGESYIKGTAKLKDYGCLVADISMVANFYGMDETPDEVVNKINAKNGFTSAGEYYWGKAEDVYKDIDLKEKYKRTNYFLKDSDINAIKDAIDAGFPVMIWLDYNPRTVKNDMHWVLIIGYDPTDENNFTIADPIDGKEKSLKKYLGWWKPSARRAIEAYVIYEGKHKNADECENCDKYKKEIEDLRKDKKQLETKINDVIKILK